MKKNSVCKICRRLGQKVLLRGEKCVSPKCPIVRRPYPPGPRRKHRGRRGTASEYAKELVEKQKLKRYYGLKEQQFRGYVDGVLRKRGGVEDTAVLLVENLERRLDNVVFKMGFARSRREARQLVSHAHFFVDSRPVNIPSFETKKKMVISVKDLKRTRVIFKNLSMTLKNYQPPAWLKLDRENLKGEIIDKPTVEEVVSAVDIPAIFEFYSR